MQKDYLHKIEVFENYQLVTFDYGHVVVRSDIVSSSLNYYSQAHGGYLFAMCDQISGLTAISTGYDAVTLQANINYLKAENLGDQLTIEGTCSHDGRSTKVIDVLIKNQAEDLLAKACFTMYVTGEHQEDVSDQ